MSRDAFSGLKWDYDRDDEIDLWGNDHVHDIYAALTTPPNTPIALMYRRAVGASRSKESRNKYQKERSAADRATLKNLKQNNPELYAKLLAEVKAEQGTTS